MGSTLAALADSTRLYRIAAVSVPRADFDSNVQFAPDGNRMLIGALDGAADWQGADKGIGQNRERAKNKPDISDPIGN